MYICAPCQKQALHRRIFGVATDFIIIPDLTRSKSLSLQLVECEESLLNSDSMT
jgi:hypothetical protein